MALERMIKVENNDLLIMIDKALEVIKYIT